MDTYRYVPAKGEGMRTYVFKVVIEPSDDRWSAYCPALLRKGAATWGYTKEEAISSIDEVVKMVVESLIDHGEPVPQEPEDQVRVSQEPCVSVTI